MKPKTLLYIHTMIKMTKKGYLAWMVLWDFIHALHKCTLSLLENTPFMIGVSKSYVRLT